MLLDLDNIADVCRGTLYLVFFILACTAYTYVANLKRKADDPRKGNYHPLAILLAPITFPLFLALAFFVLIVRALVFGLLITIFFVLLVVVRKPFIFEWWHKLAMAIGDPLLRANTFLIRAAFNIRPQKQEAV